LSSSAPTDFLGPPRKLRADAVRNREKVLEAARAEFAERGYDAQMEDVARRAGVGVGTVYRHFETKESLVEALLLQRFGESLEFTREALARVDDDPWDAFSSVLHKAADQAVRDRAFADVVVNELRSTTALDGLMNELQATMGELIERARAQNAVRDDLQTQDIPALMCGICQVGAMHPAGVDRYVEIVLAGLRGGV
jgi:AcrR family transcriptional regulator